jgi:HD-GYP domain-containing protein (c-di-GMP phosphodiesterase class II)
MEGKSMIIMTPKLQEMMENLKVTNAETYYHAIHVKYLTVKMIKKMNALSLTSFTPFENDCICKGALLHDLGKMGVGNVILTKDSALSEEEWENIKKHPVHGYNMIESELSEEEREIVKNICLYHHERIDGNGYTGMTDVPIYVQIVSVCDVFDALCSDRSYKKGMSFRKALELIETGKAGCFNELIVNFLKLVALEQAE